MNKTTFKEPREITIELLPTQACHKKKSILSGCSDNNKQLSIIQGSGVRFLWLQILLKKSCKI